ncbi:MAG: lysostaphin resistance A-like protein [Eggerthellaceae bacterium]
MVNGSRFFCSFGVSAQFLGLPLGFVEMLFPEAMAEYAELMEDTSVGVFAIVSALSIAVLAPINEEIVCRGVMLECAMRAMSPGWNAADGARYRAVSARAFWIANVLQALAFGVLHMNSSRGPTFVLGAVWAGCFGARAASLPDHPALRDERLVVFGRFRTC